MKAEHTDVGLLLVGHGSHLSTRTAEPVLALSHGLQARGVFREVREAFWKEEPSLRDALDLMAPGPVVVLPVFLADGYFTRTVVPRELGIPAVRAAGRDVEVAAPLGSHPDITRLVRIRAGEADSYDTPPSGTALVVVGHGTPRARTSDGTVRSVVHILGEEREFGLVTCAFLDQEPGLEEILALARSTPGIERITLVPFFIAEGWHAGTTLPADLATLDGSGPPVRVTPPVGTLKQVEALALDLVQAALQRPSAAPLPQGKPPSIEARAALRASVEAAGAGGVEFLEVHLQADARGRFTARHRADRTRKLRSLTPCRGQRPGVVLGRSRKGGFPRPLRSAPDLDCGWVLNRCSWITLCTFLDDLYPLTVLRWFEERSGSLRVTRFPDTAARQTGLLARVGELSPGVVVDLVEEICRGGCLRAPRWAPGSPERKERTHEEGLSVPCREACSMFLSAAAERVPAPITRRADLVPARRS